MPAIRIAAISTPQMTSSVAQRLAKARVTVTERRLFSSFFSSNFSISKAWRRRPGTTRVPVRFSWMTVNSRPSAFSCSFVSLLILRRTGSRSG
jgi:hypothetical protein